MVKSWLYRDADTPIRLSPAGGSKPQRPFTARVRSCTKPRMGPTMRTQPRQLTWSSVNTPKKNLRAQGLGDQPACAPSAPPQGRQPQALGQTHPSGSHLLSTEDKPDLCQRVTSHTSLHLNLTTTHKTPLFPSLLYFSPWYLSLPDVLFTSALPSTRTVPDAQ